MESRRHQYSIKLEELGALQAETKAALQRVETEKAEMAERLRRVEEDALARIEAAKESEQKALQEVSQAMERVSGSEQSLAQSESEKHELRARLATLDGQLADYETQKRELHEARQWISYARSLEEEVNTLRYSLGIGQQAAATPAPEMQQLRSVVDDLVDVAASRSGESATQQPTNPVQPGHDGLAAPPSNDIPPSASPEEPEEPEEPPVHQGEVSDAELDEALEEIVPDSSLQGDFAPLDENS
jgi:hypothetical protein